MLAHEDIVVVETLASQCPKYQKNLMLLLMLALLIASFGKSGDGLGFKAV